MASASCSSTSIPMRELFCCSQSLRKGGRELRLSVDGKQPGASANDTGAPGNQLLFDGKTAHILPFVNQEKLTSARKDNIQLLRKSNFIGWSVEKQPTHLIKAVATVDPKCLVPSENGHRSDSSLQFSSNSDFQVCQSSNDDSPEMDGREKLRRMRISKANKGNVPWNKGRKHSEETIRRIRERTRLAMQDPKVKMKLVNIGHAQSKETRIKIGVGVREGWQQRREKLTVQQRWLYEWQNMIAEASKKGYAGEDELQWDSYEVLDEQLKNEWLESVEKRKTISRSKGCNRGPKSPEQRRKISEAISAKWADPEYRNRVSAALAKYHGTLIGVGRKSSRKPTDETLSVKRMAAKKNPMQPRGINNEQKIIKKATPRKKRSSVPSYKDPMANSKLEMIKKIRAGRAAMETKKRDATVRAKLLIAEAEKAAKVLEVVALKSPLAQASLVETRKLIAEALKSIESIENGHLRPQENGQYTSYFCGPTNLLQTNQETPNSDKLLDRRLVNGSHVLSSSDSDYKNFDFDKFTLQNALNDRESLLAKERAESTGSLQDSRTHSLQANNLREESSRTYVQVQSKINGNRTYLHEDQSKINGTMRYSDLPPKIEDDENFHDHNDESSMASVSKTKKWVFGRLVEVEES